MKTLSQRMKFAAVLICAAVIVGVGFWYWRQPPSDTFVPIDFAKFPEACSLHHVKTEIESVENHGFMTVSHRGDWISAKIALFPLDTINDGYGHPDRSYRRILQKYCPECRKARQAWQNENKD